MGGGAAHQEGAGLAGRVCAHQAQLRGVLDTEHMEGAATLCGCLGQHQGQRPDRALHRSTAAPPLSPPLAATLRPLPASQGSDLGCATLQCYKKRKAAAAKAAGKDGKGGKDKGKKGKK